MQVLDVPAVEPHLQPPAAAIGARDLAHYTWSEFVVPHACTGIEAAFTSAAEQHILYSQVCAVLELRMRPGRFSRGLVVNRGYLDMDRLAQDNLSCVKLHLLLPPNLGSIVLR